MQRDEEVTLLTHSFPSEAAYTIRYPEFKPESNKWVIRQTGVYHRTNFKTSQSLCILLNPMPGANANKQAQDWLFDHSRDTDFDPVWLHRVLHETYLPSWRSYIAYYERQFLPMVRTSKKESGPEEGH